MSTNSLTLSNIVAKETVPLEDSECRPQTTSRSARSRRRSTLAALWILFYASFTLFHPALLDDADSVHAEVAREMLLRHDWVTLYANGIRYLEKAPLLYWSMAAAMRVSQLLGHGSARWPRRRRAHPARACGPGPRLRRRSLRPATRSQALGAGLYAALILLSSFGIFLFTRILLPDAMLCLWLTLAMLAFWLTEQSDLPQNRVPILRGFIAKDGLPSFKEARPHRQAASSATPSPPVARWAF